MTEDFVDAILRQWRAEIPDLDVDALGIFARLARFTRLSSRTLYGNIERYGLNETKFNVLAALHRVGAPYRLTPKELSTAMLLTSGAMTYVIDQLEKAGYVERRTDLQDRRSSPVELTTAGRGVIADAIRSHVALCRELLAPLSDRKLRDLTVALRTLLLSAENEEHSGAGKPVVDAR